MAKGVRLAGAGRSYPPGYAGWRIRLGSGEERAGDAAQDLESLADFQGLVRRARARGPGAFASGRALARGGPPQRIPGWREGKRAGSMLPRRIRNPPGHAR